VSDIDIAVADSLKVLDLKRPIREATKLRTSREVRFVPLGDKVHRNKNGTHFHAAYEASARVQQFGHPIKC
jgi:hypothetical protein